MRKESILNININMIILFSLVISLGLLVDNGIVVTENIYRFMEKGYSSLEATKLGIGEIAIPVITSTATTIGRMKMVASAKILLFSQLLKVVTH